MKHRAVGNWPRWCAALAAVALCGGCSQHECADCEGDTDADSDTDTDVDTDADTDSDTDDLECHQDSANCDATEENVYGVCVGQSTVDIAAGTVGMGQDGAHQVAVDSFRMDRMPVTNELYLNCVACGVCTRPAYDGSFSGREPYYGNERFADHPVIYVSWQQARDFCTGRGMDLPAEAQWELAARGGEGRSYPWGEDAPGSRLANYGYRVGDTSELPGYPDGATPEGALDMAGNVWEWVLDGYAPDYQPAPDLAIKVIRGGSFGSLAEDIAAYVRESEHQDATASTIGFRCAATD